MTSYQSRDLYQPPKRPAIDRQQVLSERFGWRSEGLKGQVVNPDIDGILTACLLHQKMGWPVVGYYDNLRLWVRKDRSIPHRQPKPLRLNSMVWVDCDLVVPGARCVSQHVVCVSPSDATAVAAFHDTVNPNLAQVYARNQHYQAKYPAGTFQWAWWLLHANDDHPNLDDEIAYGVAWTPDGAYDSVTEHFKLNVLDWALRVLPGSLLAPLAAQIEAGVPGSLEEPREQVKKATNEMRNKLPAGQRRYWSDLQFSCVKAASRKPRPDGTFEGPVVKLDPSIEEGYEMLRRIVVEICRVYRWAVPPLPHPGELETYQGNYQIGLEGKLPPGWPQSANEGEVISMAVTQQREIRWTEAGDGPRSLRHIINELSHGQSPARSH